MPYKETPRRVINQIKADYAARMPMAGIGVKHGMSKQRVKGILERAGVEIRRPGNKAGSHRGQIGQNRVDTARASGMAKGGMGIDEAATRLGTTRKKLYDAMKTDGYDPVLLFKLRGWELKRRSS